MAFQDRGGHTVGSAGDNDDVVNFQPLRGNGRVVARHGHSSNCIQGIGLTHRSAPFMIVWVKSDPSLYHRQDDSRLGQQGDRTGLLRAREALHRIGYGRLDRRKVSRAHLARHSGDRPSDTMASRTRRCRSPIGQANLHVAQGSHMGKQIEAPSNLDLIICSHTVVVRAVSDG